MKIKTLSVVVVLMALVSSLHAEDLNVSGLKTPRDKDVAAKRLLEWIKSVGYKVKLSDDGEDVFVYDTKLMLSPKLTDDSIDRIVVYNRYRGKVGNKSNPELAAVISKINTDQNAVSIFLDGDAVAFVTVLTFDDTLTPRLLRLFMDSSNKSAEIIIKANPDLSKYIP
jgi:hypothetical protein